MTYAGGIKSLLDRGIIVKWAIGPRVYLALNQHYPVYRELRKLLREIVPAKIGYDPDFEPLGPETLKRKPNGATRSYDLEKIFGWKNRTSFFLLLEAMNGSIERAAFFRGMHDVAPQVVRKNIAEFKRCGLIVEGDFKGVRQLAFAGTAPPALRRLCRKLLEEMPQYKQRAKLARTTPTIVKGSVGGRTLWLGGVRGATKPMGLQAPASGAPLLFGSDARYRLLAALAIGGPMRATRLWKLAKVQNNHTLSTFVDGGFAITEGRTPFVVYSLNPTIPVRKELVSLLKALHRKFPAFDETQLPQEEYAISRPPSRWTGDFEKISVLPMRLKTLLAVSASRGVDSSSLSRMFPEHVRMQLRQTMHKLLFYGVVESYREGSAIMYRLDDGFCAHRELAQYLGAVLKMWPVYKTLAKNTERSMQPLRLKMRDNARKSKKPRKVK